MDSVFLSLGSNLGNRLAQLKNAYTGIEKNIGNIIGYSRIYETEPWGFQADNNFLNQVIFITTPLSPLPLLSELKKLEMSAGRKPSECKSYSSRPLDIDILFYGQRIINTPELIIPHPRLHERKFVLVPLQEIAPDLIHPVQQKSVSELTRLLKDDTNIWLYKPPESQAGQT